MYVCLVELLLWCHVRTPCLQLSRLRVALDALNAGFDGPVSELLQRSRLRLEAAATLSVGELQATTSSAGSAAGSVDSAGSAAPLSETTGSAGPAGAGATTLSAAASVSASPGELDDDALLQLALSMSLSGPSEAKKS